MLSVVFCCCFLETESTTAVTNGDVTTGNHSKRNRTGCVDVICTIGLYRAPNHTRPLPACVCVCILYLNIYCMHVCMYVCMHAYMYACMYVCMYVCTYVCMYVFYI